VKRRRRRSESGESCNATTPPRRRPYRRLVGLGKIRKDKAFQDVFLERNVFSIDKQICAKNEVVNACNSIFFLNATLCVEVVEKKIE